MPRLKMRVRPNWIAGTAIGAIRAIIAEICRMNARSACVNFGGSWVGSHGAVLGEAHCYGRDRPSGAGEPVGAAEWDFPPSARSRSSPSQHCVRSSAKWSILNELMRAVSG